MQRGWSKTLLLAGFLALTGSSIAAAATAYTNSSVNLRYRPSLRSELIRVVPAGRRVHVLNCVRGNTWCHISYRGWDGYVSERYLDFEDDDYFYRGQPAPLPPFFENLVPGLPTDDPRPRPLPY
ncbi:MAG: SH3 domain-containing protein [Hyphomicrobiales bacterium]|nr:SH3 domain-containing protein [Hyphomicrobiales bacterium]